MESVRQRKVQAKKYEDGDMVAGQSRKSSKQGSSMKRLFLFLSGSIFLLIIVGSFYGILPGSIQKHGTGVIDNLALFVGVQEHSHAVVIDAGSTGSRVLAFTFHKSLIDGSLKLDHELFEEVKPGLSSFADDPKQGAETLNTLLEKAKNVIPKADWKRTPLAMKATAGLRLLPQDKADGILQEARNFLDKSGFYTNKNSVSIMDGDDEGLFSWFTVNFLLDRLGRSAEHTVVALDLGGGSTQITFAPKNEATVKSSPSEYMHHISVFHTSLDIYTHSYLGLGLQAARKGIMGTGNPKDATVLKSECINPIINTTWTFGGVTYSVTGPEKPTYEDIKPKKGEVGEKRPIVNKELCTKLVRGYVKDKVHAPAELSGREINAFSYYYDRATEVGLIDPFTGGVITVQDFVKAAKSACGNPNADQPFMCLDLSFISVLLHDGFGLRPETKLHLVKKIDGHELSWALGAAFHILQNGL